MDFEKIETFIFDLDGTVWYWTKLIPGVKRTIRKLIKLDKEIMFVSNNTIVSRKDLAKRLNRFGIKIHSNSVINAGFVIGYYIKERNGTALALNDGTERDLREVGVRVKKKPPVDYVVVTEDWDFDHEELSLAKYAIEGGGKLLTSIIGREWKVGDRMIPGVGCWVKAVEFAANTKAKCLGKPSNYMVKIVSRRLKHPERSVLIGDEFKSDILFGKKLGCKTIFVKTGMDRGVKSKIKPDLPLDSVKDLLNYI